MKQPHLYRLLTGVAASCLVLAWLVSGSVGVAQAASGTLYVSPNAKPHRSDTSCSTARFRKIQAAVKAAPAGGKVVVCAGDYTLANQGFYYGQTVRAVVLIRKPLRLRGQDAVIDASGPTTADSALTGITIISSHVKVRGFTVTGAVDEGILAEPPAAFAAGGSETPKKPVAPITHVVVGHNEVNGDNRGFVSPQGCVLPTEYFGDCGGGIHFNAVADSKLRHNFVSDNADGVLITDEAGPAHNIRIAHNDVVDNPIECGITLPSHNGGAASFKPGPNGFQVTGVNPGVGGVYDNVVKDNISLRNGTAGFHGNSAGSGGGVGIFAPAPGTAAYGNVVEGNVVGGNGLAGVVIHGHYTGGEYMAGNQILDNIVGRNNVAGDPLDFPWTTEDMQTTGILIMSAGAVKLTVSGNQISHDAYGIWHNKAVTLTGTNSYSSVTAKIVSPKVPFGSAFCVPVFFAPQNCPQASGKTTLNGFVVPNGLPTIYYFLYGTNKSSLTSKTPTQNAGSGVTPVFVSATIKGLKGKTTYYFQLVAKNSAGTHTGMELSFATK